MEQNNMPPNNTLPGEANITIEQNPKKRNKKRTGWYIAGAICGAVLIAVGVFAILRAANQPETEPQVAENTETTTDTNTNLSAGTVTTTIDGRTITYTAAYVVDGVEATITSGEYASAADDEAVFLVINGGALKIDGDVKISKTGSSDFQGRGDNYSFYGTNSAIVVVGEGSSASINGATITTDVSGANAVVATNGSAAVIANSQIATSRDNSRGLHATYGGSINADSTTIETQGGSSASLSTDRGGGSIVAANMTLSTAGAGSPLIYSTGDITVSNSTGTSTGAQIAVVEGKNSITLDGCEFSANGVGNRNGVDNAAVMIYQSMSGDASVGTGAFTATDCTLTVLTDSSVYTETPFFFVTNTNATIDLTSTTMNFYDDQAFISATGTSEWGRSGANGGNATITMTGSTATNTNIITDDISTISGI